MSIGVAIFPILILATAIAIEITTLAIISIAVILDFTEKIKERKRNRLEKKK